MTEQETHDDVRRTVSGSYERALQRTRQAATGTGCCGSGAAAGSAAKLVDYGADAEALPEEAVRGSFGCGNPLAFSQVREGETVVDLGSGAGLDLLLAARRVGPTGRVIGVDMTDAMLAEARRNLDRAGATNVELRKGIIEELPLADDEADWVISNCVINLSPDKPAVFRELFRALAPGGRISISDIVVEELPEALRRHAAIRSACIGGAMSEGEYVAGLEAAGLEAVEVVERLVYDEDQLLAIVTSEELVGEDLAADGVDEDELRAAIRSVAGRAWSAKFQARKPARDAD